MNVLVIGAAAGGGKDGDVVVELSPFMLFWNSSSASSSMDDITSGTPRSEDFFITLRELLLNADDTDAPELRRAERREDTEPPRDVSETSSIDVLSLEEA